MVFILILVSIIISLQNNFKKNPNTFNSDKSLLSKEAIVTNIWLEDYDKLSVFQNHCIKYLIVDVGGTGPDGQLLTPKEDILYFLDFIENYENNNNYTFILLPYSEINTYDYNLTPEFENNFIEDYNDLALSGFDGIFVDIEPVKFEERQNYLNLLEKLKLKLQNSSIISVYSGHIALDENTDNEWEWNYEFIKQVSDRVDIISVPVYDTSFTNKKDYQNHVKYTMNKILSNQWNSSFFLAVPTHKKPPETLINVQSIYIKEVSKYPDNKLLGMDIFSSWTINNNEWRIFRNYLVETGKINKCGI